MDLSLETKSMIRTQIAIADSDWKTTNMSLFSLFAIKRDAFLKENTLYEELPPHQRMQGWHAYKFKDGVHLFRVAHPWHDVTEKEIKGLIDDGWYCPGYSNSNAEIFSNTYV